MKDIPNFKSDEYLLYEDSLHLVNDVYQGVKTAVKHLDKYSKEVYGDYLKRQATATLDNFVGKTIRSIKNIVFRKNVDLSNISNSQLEILLGKIDLKQDVTEFAKDVCINLVKDGHTFILIDAPVYDENITTRQDEILSGVRPYFINILRSQVINWKKDKNDNFISITINETYSENEGKFKTVTQIQQRVIYNTGIVEIWREDNLFSSVDTGLNFVPIVQVGKELVPPLYDLARLNIVHVNERSEKRRYLRIGASPFLATFGKLDSGIKTLGIDTGLSFTSKQDSDVRWVEMSGSNYKSLQDDLTELEKTMLNVAITLATSSNIKTATQVEKESTEDESKLTDSANQVEQSLNKAIVILGIYLNQDLSDQFVKVNKDFDSSLLTPEQIKTYQDLYIQNIISWDKLISLLQHGEALPHMNDKELEEERGKILTEITGI